MSNETTMTQVKNIDKILWRQFRAKSIMSGFDSANECLLKLIGMYARDKINVIKK